MTNDKIVKSCQMDLFNRARINYMSLNFPKLI